MADSSRWSARLVVLMLHALLLGALWLHRPARHDAHPERVITALRLIEPRPSAPRPVPATAPRLPSVQSPGLRPPFVPVPVPVPVPADLEPTSEPPSAAAAAADRLEPSRSTLRLNLPSRMSASASAPARNPALTDARSNSPRYTLEDKLADAMGGADGQWHEERMGDSRSILRRGDTCIEVFKSRIADTTLAFDQGMRPTPKMVGKPYKCK